MRVNVYHEELVNETRWWWHRYYGLRMFLASASELHFKPNDDDRSAVTIWFGTLTEAEDALKTALETVQTNRESLRR